MTALCPLLSPETTAALHSREMVWTGAYKLQVEVSDAQGLSCPANEIFTVEVCQCVDTDDCSSKPTDLKPTSTEFGAPAIGLLLMGMCLLLCELITPSYIQIPSLQQRFYYFLIDSFLRSVAIDPLKHCQSYTAYPVLSMGKGLWFNLKVVFNRFFSISISNSSSCVL